eukprot:9391060-Lingulodinium_polyedra.AAC.1
MVRNAGPAGHQTALCDAALAWAGSGRRIGARAWSPHVGQSGRSRIGIGPRQAHGTTRLIGVPQ